ncbi:MAG: polysaccharide deacetylase family protein [Clostridium sp.]|nr:polysaccharide deacetylase family protein [Clostridium sp.]
MCLRKKRACLIAGCLGIAMLCAGIYIKAWGTDVFVPAWKHADIRGQGEMNIKKVALTFDDGPHPRYTARLLEGLRERDVRVTFFVLGQSAELYPDLIKEMAQDGHLIGNHTYSHIQLTSRNGQQFVEELQKTDVIIYELTGQHTEFVRPPYGTWDKRYEESLNMIQVLWNVDPLDWCCSDAGTVTSRVLEKADEDCIILLHDVYASSVEAALAIVDELSAQGYEFVTVDEIILD